MNSGFHLPAVSRSWVGCSLDAGYQAARCAQIAGLFRIGRLMRVNWQAFVASTATPAGERP